MMRISLVDYIRDALHEDVEATDFAVVDESDGEGETCPGCMGKGKYVGFLRVEDPCEVCDGTGAVDRPDRDAN